MVYLISFTFFWRMHVWGWWKYLRIVGKVFAYFEWFFFVSYLIESLNISVDQSSRKDIKSRWSRCGSGKWTWSGREPKGIEFNLHWGLNHVGILNRPDWWWRWPAVGGMFLVDVNELIAHWHWLFDFFKKNSKN